MTKLYLEPPGGHFGPVFDLWAQCLSLGFSAPMTDPTTAAATRRRKAPSVSSSCRPSRLLPLSRGWSLSLRSGKGSVNEVVAVESRGVQAGRKEGRKKCQMWADQVRTCLNVNGDFCSPVQEHNRMSARMSFVLLLAFSSLLLSFCLHHVSLFPVSHNKL